MTSRSQHFWRSILLLGLAVLGSGACSGSDDRTASCPAERSCVKGCVEGQTTTSGHVCRGGVSVSCAELEAAEACATCGCGPFGGGSCVPGVGCFTPREQGAACSYDQQCVTQSCSNDGDLNVQGTCGQTLGTYCTDLETCTLCVGMTATKAGVCTRWSCDSKTAPCPPLWSCLPRAAGGQRCFQQCHFDTDCVVGFCNGDVCSTAS